MTYRRRIRWFRRMAVGLAFATFAAPAAAKLDPSGNDAPVVLDPLLSDVFVRIAGL